MNTITIPVNWLIEGLIVVVIIVAIYYLPKLFFVFRSYFEKRSKKFFCECPKFVIAGEEIYKLSIIEVLYIMADEKDPTINRYYIGLKGRSSDFNITKEQYYQIISQICPSIKDGGGENIRRQKDNKVREE